MTSVCFQEGDHHVSFFSRWEIRGYRRGEGRLQLFVCVQCKDIYDVRWQHSVMSGRLYIQLVEICLTPPSEWSRAGGPGVGGVGASSGR